MENKNIYRKKLAIALKEQGKSYKEIGEIFGIIVMEKYVF